MIALQIEDIKLFMNKLLKDSTFDDFEVVSLALTHSIAISIEGKLNKDYYSAQEQENLTNQDYMKWNELRPIMLPLMRGSKPPASLKLILAVSEKSRHSLLERSGSTLPTDAVNGFLLNIQYQNKALKVITGTNYKQFTLDKSLEHYFDETMRRFFTKHEIPVSPAAD